MGKFGIALRRGGQTTYKLNFEISTDSRTQGKPTDVKQIEVVPKHFDPYSNVRLCAGVAWKKRTNRPKNYQPLQVRKCDESETFNRKQWMDKFFHEKDSGLIKDAASKRTCWTYYRPRKRSPRVVTLKCQRSKRKWQQWVHDDSSGSMCLKSNLKLCIQAVAEVSNKPFPSRSVKVKFHLSETPKLINRISGHSHS